MYHTSRFFSTGHQSLCHEITAVGTCRRSAGLVSRSFRNRELLAQKPSSRHSKSNATVTTAAAAMSRPSLVLVHGNFGTAAGWAPFQKSMESRGYDVHAIDLPWEKSPRTGGVPDLQDYTQALIQFVRDKQLKSVALVGHSFGGVPVSLATEALQEETKAIVYLDAHLLQDNENFTAFLPESFMEGVRQEAAETGGWWFRKCIPADKWAAGYYNDVSYEEAKKAWDASHNEPINVWLDRVNLPASFSNTSRPSIFIEFLNDKCHGPEHWKLMVQRLPNCITRKTPGSHFAFVTHPEEVADALDDALQEAL